MKRIFLLLLMGIALNGVSQIPTDSLVGYYPFNGNANDVSGNTNNGTVNGATLTLDRFGNANSAYNFNGSSDYIGLPNVIPVFKGSISYWYKTNGSHEGQVIVYHTNTVDNGFGTIHNAMESHTAISTDTSNYFVFDNGAGISYTDSIISVSLDTWYHVILTYDKQDSARMYINGDLVNTTDLSTEVGTYTPTTTYIGRPSMNTRFFNGVFDDLRIYNRVIENMEIIDLYNEGKCFETVYDTVLISVTDTLIIDAVLTSIDPPNNKNQLKVYPNPAKEYLMINTGEYERMTNYVIKIINQSGQTVYETIIDQPEYEINLSTWTGNGLYFLQLFDDIGDLIDVKKIVIQ